MSNIAMIQVEGPLAASDLLSSAAPQKWAIPLYEAIRSQFRTVAVSRNTDAEIVRWWLRKEHLPGWSAVHRWDSPLSYDDWVVDLVREYLANGWEMAFLLTNDPGISQRVRDMGVLTLTIGAPVHPPGWRADDSTFQPWDQLVDTLDPRP